MSEQQQYDTPATFVNVKRVRTGEKDSKGRDKSTFTIGLGTDKQGNQINNLDNLIAALMELQGKQVNLTFYVEEKEGKNGRTFPSAFLKVTEMIPKEQQQAGQTAYVPKTNSRAASVQAKAKEISQKFNAGT